MPSRKAPATVSGRSRISSTWCSKPGGSLVSACRNRRTVPSAARAPAFICVDLIGAEAITFAPEARALSSVPSRLPPSTTILSVTEGIPSVPASADSIPSASSIAGMMIDRVLGSSPRPPARTSSSQTGMSSGRSTSSRGSSNATLRLLADAASRVLCSTSPVPHGIPSKRSGAGLLSPIR